MLLSNKRIHKCRLKTWNCWCVATKHSSKIFQQLRTINIQTAVFWSLALAFSTLFHYKNQVLKNSLQHCCHKSKLQFFQPMDYLMKLKCVIPTTNVLSVSVKTTKCVVWNSKILPTLFQVSYQSNKLINSLEKSTKVNSKLETVEALKQNPENAPKKSSAAILFSNIQQFLGLFLNSPLTFHIEAPQNKEHT